MYPRARLPGIYVDTVNPPPQEGLPRMDVAVFVGFAARGPTHRPVAVDSVAAFEAVFGGDLSLAFDPERGDTIRANLPSSVRAFFSNGGTLCWVIRVAMTRALANLRHEYPFCAESNSFALSGALAVKSGSIRPARMEASSAGSWSDSLTLAARADREMISVTGVQAVDTIGLTFDDLNGLAAGDLIEFSDASLTSYARIQSVANGTAQAEWVAAFAPMGTLSRGSGLQGMAGSWINWVEGGKTVWLLAEKAEGYVVTGPAWAVAQPALPGTSAVAHRVRMEILQREDGKSAIFDGLRLCPGADDAVQSIVPDDDFYDGASQVAATLRPAFAVNPNRFCAQAVWLPLGLGATFGAGSGPLPIGGGQLARDGLLINDHRLYLDPRLADLTVSALTGQAENLRHVQDQALFGIHAAIGIPGDLYSPASLIALPDAAQPEWSATRDLPQRLTPQPGTPDFANWQNHASDCPPPKLDHPLEGPDQGQFLDCTTRKLQTPVFTDDHAVSDDGSFSIAWQNTVIGYTYFLEESPRHDFAVAVEVLRGEPPYATNGRVDGVYYYRLRAEFEGNSSDFATFTQIVRTTDNVVVNATPAQQAKRLRAIHVPLMRFAAATGDYFAILSLPRNFRAKEAAIYSRKLTRTAPGFGGLDQIGVEEVRALSFAALYHPWLVARRGGALESAPPDGAIAGVYAARAIARGAWIAPANEVIRDIVGLDPAIPAAELLLLDESRVNTIRDLPQGFSVLDTDTLSNENDWRHANVRRLMMLIRRSALKRGITFVFEPNGDVVRRALERSFLLMLDDLQRRGAFSGKSSEESFRLLLPEAVNDRDEGRLTVEIAVSPAQPLRFLTLRMAQQGSRLTISEAA